MLLSGLPRRSSWQLYRPLSSGCSCCRVRLKVMPPGPGAEDSRTFSTGNWEEEEGLPPWWRFEWYNTSTGARSLCRFRLTPSTAKPPPCGERQGSTAEPPAHVSTNPVPTDPGASPEGRGNKTLNMTCGVFTLSKSPNRISSGWSKYVFGLAAVRLSGGVLSVSYTVFRVGALLITCAVKCTQTEITECNLLIN